MKAKLTVNGETFDVDISDEQAKALTENKKTGFERVKHGRRYYPVIINSDITGCYKEENDLTDDKLYESGNYLNDQSFRNDYARMLKLFLKLSQWQALYDDPIRCDEWYEITLNYEGELDTICSCRTTSRFGAIKFSEELIAEKAIEAFRNDLEWYFKEFKPRLDM